MNDIEKKVWEALKKVKDPELKVSVVEAGLIKKVEERDRVVTVEFALTTPFCPYTDFLALAIKKAAESIEGVKEVRVRVVGFQSFI